MVSTRGSERSALIYMHERAPHHMLLPGKMRARADKYTGGTCTPTQSRASERPSENNIAFHGGTWCGTERSIAEVGTDR